MRTAPAGDTEQNGAKHFTVARRAIVTCFRRVMIVFAGICKGKLKIVTCFARQKSFIVLFLWRTKHVTISRFPLQMPAKSIVMRLKHVTNARRATRKCQISLSHKPGTVETVRFPRKMLLEQGWTCDKNATFHGRCIALTTNECTVSLSNMPGTTSGTAVQIVRGLG